MINNIIKEIRKYAEIQNDEWGEYVRTLIHLYEYEYIMDSQLSCAIKDALKWILADYKKNYIIIEEVTTQKIITKRLERCEEV